MVMRFVRRAAAWIVTGIVLLITLGYGLYAANGIRDELRLRARHEERAPRLAETATAIYERLTLVAEPTVTATATPTATPTATASATASATMTLSITPSTTPSATPSQTALPPSITPIPTNTPRFTPTPTGP